MGDDKNGLNFFLLSLLIAAGSAFQVSLLSTQLGLVERAEIFQLDINDLFLCDSEL